MSDSYMPIENAGTLRAEERALEREVQSVRRQVASLPNCSPHRPRLEARLEASEQRLGVVRKTLAQPPEPEGGCSCGKPRITRNAFVLAGEGIARVKADLKGTRDQVSNLKRQMEAAGIRTEPPKREYMPTKAY